MKTQFMQLIRVAFILSISISALTGCTKKEESNLAASGDPILKALPTPNWKAEARCFLDGPSGSFDDIAVKDPSIVYSGGSYHLYYTGRTSIWSLGYARASTIAGLKTATHTRLTNIGTGGGLAAPQIFWFPVKGKWFLIYQNGRTASFSTNTDVGNPAGWTPVRSMGFSDGIDFWCVSDGSYVYCFYSAADGTRTVKRRRTTIANFPYNWEAPTVVATNAFEGVHTYKNKADGKYYMIVEDINRHQELWTSSTLGGTWTQVSEKWASRDRLTFLAEVWTDEVSHIEVLRSGTDEKMEIDNIDRCQMLIQGVLKGSYPDYGSIPYDIGLIRNY